MISVQQALESVRKNCKCNSDSFTIKLKDAHNFVLFSNVTSPINMPPFRQSAMDGYALNIHNDLNYKLVGEIKAGDNTNP